MSQSVIQVEGLSKRYQLGTIGYGSLQHDLRALWAKIRGNEDPNAKIGEKGRLDLHGEFWALRDVGFEVQQGDRVGVLGRNGAGKSTLLKLLSRVTSPTNGSIKVRGRIASLLEVGTGFHPELTGRENIFLNGAILGMGRREIQEKFDEIVGFAGVEQFIDTPVKRYSSGMYVRLAFSVAAHLDSEILIIDEVLAVGDADFQRKCVSKMESLSVKQGKTILFVSHAAALIRSFCQSAILLKAGTVAYTGNVGGALTLYQGIEGLTLSLRDRTDRDGSGLARIVECRLVNISGEAANIFISRDPMTVELSIESRTYRGHVIVSMNIQDSMGNDIAQFVSDEHGNHLALDAESSLVQFQLPQLALRAGAYQLRLFLSGPTTMPKDHLDVLPNATKFTVEAASNQATAELERPGTMALIDCRVSQIS